MAQAKRARAAAAHEGVSTDKLAADLRQDVVDVEDLLRATAGQAGEKFQEGREKLEATLQNAKERLKGFEESALERAREYGQDADAYVRENPWQAISITAGVAFLLGILVSRR